MAIKTIKEIIDSKGYVINSKDRAIFETGDLRSFFGLSDSDAIEFVVYDSSDNQLPQTNGLLVRYIPLTNENIKDYILLPEGTIFQKYSLPNEYFIDAERLLKEAGYTNGIFKTQITLINKRAGSEMKDDKLYINEISPSRTEVRLFPVMRSNSDALKQNLRERFNIFIKDGQFREDVIVNAIECIEKINPSVISENLISKYGNNWLENLKREYKINDFDVLMNQIHRQFIEACIYEFTNKISDINNINYGKQKPIQADISLNTEFIKSKISRLMVMSINKYLSTPKTITKTTSEMSILETEDDIRRVMQRKESDVKIDTKAPVIEIAERKKPVITDKEVLINDKIKKQLPTDGSEPIQISQPIEEPVIGLPVIGGGSGGGIYNPPIIRDITEPFNPSLAGGSKPREAMQ